jgi:hypothetical protein
MLYLSYHLNVDRLKRTLLSELSVLSVLSVILKMLMKKTEVFDVAVNQQFFAVRGFFF